MCMVGMLGTSPVIIIFSNLPWRPLARRTLGSEKTSCMTIGKILANIGRQYPSTIVECETAQEINQCIQPFAGVKGN